ncbi:hypothetical protein ACLOAV_005055 [Pseudogymnoascus australis]
MRGFRGELEDEVVKERCLFLVANTIEWKRSLLDPVGSNKDSKNTPLPRAIWRKLLTKDDMSKILALLRPGADVETILDAEEEDGVVWEWCQWTYRCVA